jgi:hypothetical protein
MAIAGSSTNTLRRVRLRLAAYTPKDGGEVGLLQEARLFVCHKKYTTYEVKAI